MKLRIFLPVLFFSFSALCFAQEDVEKPAPPPGNALIGDYYGNDISNSSMANSISVEKLEEKLKAGNKIENVVVKGEVSGVCPKKGCWVSVKTEDGASFFVKMRDYSFFVPTALKGKNVVLEGTAEREVTSVEELRHYAKDAKKTKEEIGAIKSPKEEIRFVASGIKVVD